MLAMLKTFIKSASIVGLREKKKKKTLFPVNKLLIHNFRIIICNLYFSLLLNLFMGWIINLKILIFFLKKDMKPFKSRFIVVGPKALINIYETLSIMKKKSNTIWIHR